MNIHYRIKEKAKQRIAKEISRKYRRGVAKGRDILKKFLSVDENARILNLIMNRFGLKIFVVDRTRETKRRFLVVKDMEEIYLDVKDGSDMPRWESICWMDEKTCLKELVEMVSRKGVVLLGEKYDNLEYENIGEIPKFDSYSDLKMRYELEGR